jgi:hypothetical protein
VGTGVGGIGVGSTTVKQAQETSGSMPLDTVTIYAPAGNPAGTVAVNTKSFPTVVGMAELFNKTTGDPVENPEPLIVIVVEMLFTT